MLVDDAPEILAAWSLILVNEGYSVTRARNGVEAVECLKQHLPGLVITDWIMPLMDGLTLCREMRARPYLAHIPILGHSAAPPTDVRQPEWNLCPKKSVAASLFLTTVGNLCKGAFWRSSKRHQRVLSRLATGAARGKHSSQKNARLKDGQFHIRRRYGEETASR